MMTKRLQENTGALRCWQVSTCPADGLVPSGHKLLPELILAVMGLYDVVVGQWVKPMVAIQHLLFTYGNMIWKYIKTYLFVTNLPKFNILLHSFASAYQICVDVFILPSDQYYITRPCVVRQLSWFDQVIHVHILCCSLRFFQGNIKTTCVNSSLLYISPTNKIYIVVSNRKTLATWQCQFCNN